MPKPSIKSKPKIKEASKTKERAKRCSKPNPVKKSIAIKKRELCSTQSNKPDVDSPNGVGKLVPKILKSVIKAPTKSISIKNQEVVNEQTATIIRTKSVPKKVTKETNSPKKQEAAVLSASNKQIAGDGRRSRSRSNKFIRIRYELDFAETGSNANVDDCVKYLLDNMKVDGRKNNLENVAIKKRNDTKVQIMAKVNIKKRSLKYLTEKFLDKHHLKYKVVSKNKRSYKIIPKKDKQ